MTRRGVIEPDLLVTTFNVRRPFPALLSRPADRWEGRRPRVEALVRDAAPTILGLQEAVPAQADAVGRALGPRHRRVGHGRRRDGRGEGCPLFIDERRLELEGWRQIELSSPLGGSATRTLWPRILVEARLRDRATGARLLVVNTHLDPLSRRARDQAADRILSLVADAALPAVVMGDLNASSGSSTLRRLLDAGKLTDAWQRARERTTPLWGTYADYRRPRAGARRLDWILVTPSVEVERCGIDARRHAGGWPSDHLPVHAVLRLPGAGGLR